MPQALQEIQPQALPTSNSVNEEYAMTDTTSQKSTRASEPDSENAQSAWAALVSASGYILAVSYPVLALSTGTRAVYQLFFKEGVTELLPPLLSLLAATCYLVATLGFAWRHRWTWWLSMLSLGIETLLTLVVGIWSYVDPALIGRTVWRHFGADYGYFPLFQPIIGLLWLIWPATLAMYGFKSSAPASHAPADLKS